MRVKITLACTECKQRNYDTMKNKKNDPDRLEMNKYCRFCRKHTLHRETKYEKGSSCMAEETKAKKPGLFARIGKWFRELKSECRKIVWPTREQTVNNTLVVLASVVIIGIFIWVLDIVFGLGIQTLLTHTTAA